MYTVYNIVYILNGGKKKSECKRVENSELLYYGPEKHMAFIDIIIFFIERPVGKMVFHHRYIYVYTDKPFDNFPTFFTSNFGR